jgi:hypothetical protein
MNMKKYFLLTLALGLCTAQTAAMYRKISRAFRFTKTTSIGAITGGSAVMVAANECPLKDEKQKTTKTALRAGLIIGATVAT